MSDTTTPEFRWRSTIRVTADGNPALTDGIAFTAASGDGRITGDGTPLVDAIVRVTDPSGNVIYQATTDSDGLWGTVYLNDSTSYTIHVQATNYTSTTSTITTSGGTAVGPLADVNVVTASTTSELQASKLWAYARRMSGDKVGLKSTTQIKQAVNSALGHLGRVAKWPWLNDRGRINVRMFTNEGTVTVTDDSAIVTLAGATWPSWVAGTEFLHDGVSTTISTRDSDTQITLEFAFNGTTAASQEYTVFQYKYDLPTDCLQVDTLLGGRRFPAGSQFMDMASLEQTRDRLDFSNPDAFFWSASAGTIAIWPYPAEDRMLNYVYYKKPADLINDSDTADWDIASISLLYRAIDYHIAITMGCVAGSVEQTLRTFNDELTQHLPNDKSTANADLSVSPSGDGSGTVNSNWLSTMIVT